MLKPRKLSYKPPFKAPKSSRGFAYKVAEYVLSYDSRCVEYHLEHPKKALIKTQRIRSRLSDELSQDPTSMDSLGNNGPSNEIGPESSHNESKHMFSGNHPINNKNDVIRKRKSIELWR